MLDPRLDLVTYLDVIGTEEQCARTSHSLTLFLKYLDAVKTLEFLRALMCALYVPRPAESSAPRGEAWDRWQGGDQSGSCQAALVTPITHKL